MDALRLADIRAGTDARAESCGSGYLVGPRLVLTAHHVIARGGEVWPRIEVRIGHIGHNAPTRVGARVCWPAVGGDPVTGPGAWDVALLELDRPVEREQPVRWGQPVGTRPLEYTGMGFPLLAEYEDSVRGVEQLGGTIPPLATGVGGAFVLDQIAGPRLRASGERAWDGVSGAAVFCQGLLVGVVVKDDEQFENRRLHATAVWRFAREPRFVELVRKQTGALPLVEPVELAGSLDCRMAPVTARTPGSLLAAAAEAVAFHGRHGELTELTAWRDDGPSVSVKLVTGEGGQGKSRLARRFCQASREAGWVAGLTEPARAVDERAARGLLHERQQEASARLLAEQLADSTVAALVVCDYAEVHPVFVDTLVSALAERPGQRPVRVLLLSRARGAWWQDLTALLGPAASSLPLEALSTGDAAQHEAYTAAVAELAGALEHLPQPPIGQAPVAPWSALANRLMSDPPAFIGDGNALTSQMIALLDLLQSASGVTRVTDESPERRLVEHERDYLRRTAAGKGLLAAGVLSTATATNRRRRQALQALDRALAGAILLGPCDPYTARRVGELATHDHADDVVDWLGTLYPPPPGQRLATGPIQPDRLAEHLLGGILTDTNHFNDQVHAALLPQIGTLTGELQSAQSVLFALVRTAAHRPFHDVVGQGITQLITGCPDPFAAAAPLLATVPGHRRLLLDSLHQLAKDDPSALPTQVWRASAILPRTSVSLAFFSAAVTEILTELFAHLARDNRGAYLPDLAMSLNNHAVRLAEVGRREAAMPVSEEAVR
ncbi:trypsin-like serine protease, partial [Streptomyces sp. NPDC048436]|uniref:trypsin-like serine protease n=1 Tax=Streptomyces sp. NPDC048436 TaxID=3365550 RepID=UPI003721CA4B